MFINTTYSLTSTYYNLVYLNMGHALCLRRRRYVQLYITRLSCHEHHGGIFRLLNIKPSSASITKWLQEDNCNLANTH